MRPVYSRDSPASPRWPADGRLSVDVDDVGILGAEITPDRPCRRSALRSRHWPASPPSASGLYGDLPGVRPVAELGSPGASWLDQAGVEHDLQVPARRSPAMPGHGHQLCRGLRGLEEDENPRSGRSGRRAQALGRPGESVRCDGVGSLLLGAHLVRRPGRNG